MKELEQSYCGCCCCAPARRKARRNLVLFLLLAVWLVSGTVVFWAVERPAEEKRIAEELNQRQHFRSLIEASLNLSEEVEEATRQDRKVVVTNGTVTIRVPVDYFLRHNYTPYETLSKFCPPVSDIPKWDLSGSLFFVITVVSTIGYGNYAPSTTIGRGLCIVYAILGIPICWLCVEIMQRLFVKIANRISQLTKKAASFINTIQIDEKVPEKTSSKKMSYFNMLILAVSGIALFFLIPAVIFNQLEGWEYLTSLYYAHVTLGTIGFGDLVGGQKQTGVVRQFYRLFLSAWILFGIAFTSAVQMMIGRILLDRVDRFVKWTTYDCNNEKQQKKKSYTNSISTITSAAPSTDEIADDNNSFYTMSL